MRVIGRALSILFTCWLMRSHAWTCKHDQGIEPVRDEVQRAVKEGSAAVLASFQEYSRMYCARCGYIYNPGIGGGW